MSTPAVISPQRKLAYNYLLYQAMVEIRGIEWVGQKRKWSIANIRVWFHNRNLRYIEYCGALANALHNLARYSSLDYKGFEEDWFWKEMDNLQAKFPHCGRDYREEFNHHLSRLEPNVGSKNTDESFASASTEPGRATH